MYKIIIITIAVFMTVSCSSTVKLPSSYDPMDLMNGVYTRSGNPYTGRGYVHEETTVEQSGEGNANYDMEYENGDITYLRTPEIIKKMVICPQMQNGIMIRKTEIFLVIKKCDWVLE